MLGNFIYAKNKNFFLKQLEEGHISDEAIVFIEDTKQIWNHGTYFDCSVTSEIFNNYKTEVNNTYATKTSLDSKVDKVSGKQLSTEDFTTALKSKLEDLKIHKKIYRSLSSTPSEDYGWYMIAEIDDTESTLFQVSTGGHSDVIFTVSTGWGGNLGGSLTILNSYFSESNPDDVNEHHAHVTAVRIRKNNNKVQVEVKLKNPTGNNSTYVNIVVSAYTNAGHDNFLQNSLNLASSDDNTLQTFELKNQALMSEKVITSQILADNLADVATSGSYEDLTDKPVIPEAYNDASIREALNQKANKSELFSKNYNDLNNKPTIPAAVTESTVGDWGFTKVIKVTWDALSNMNDFKTPGVYEIYGDRTVKTDNLPIANDGSGNSIAARLTVVASTLQPTNNEICITQFLQLSNRIGGEGTTYVRTYNENNNGMNGWSSWQKQMGMVETLINSNDTTVNQYIFTGTADKIGDGLNGMIDNGMYSGIYIDNLTYTGTGSMYYLSAQPTFIETFVLIVINDYAISGELTLPRHITQLKYAVDAITGQSTVKKRVGTDNNGISWSDWEDVYSQEIDITEKLRSDKLALIANSLKPNVTYTATHSADSSSPIKLDWDNKIINKLNESGNNYIWNIYINHIRIRNKYAQSAGYVIEAFGYTNESTNSVIYYTFILNNGTTTVKMLSPTTEL